MKTTASSPDKVIIYDASCPMCRWYTGVFVNNNMLPANGRVDFGELPASGLASKLDLQRARHEIPLVDTRGGETLYGLDAMVHVLGSRFPFIKKVMGVKPVYAFFKQFYTLISYNRRVIAGTATPTHGVDCAPDVNLPYRFAYVLIALTVAVAISIGFGNSVSAYVPQALSPVQSLLIVGSGWAVQLLLAALFIGGKRLDYLGNLVTIMVIGVLVLLPGMLVQAIAGPVWVGIPLISVGCSSGLMLWEHVRRTGNLQLPQYWTVLWFIALQTTAIFWMLQFKLIQL